MTAASGPPLGAKLVCPSRRNSTVKLGGKNLSHSLKREPSLFDSGILRISVGEFEGSVEQGVLKQSNHPDDLRLKDLGPDNGIERDFTGSSFDLLGLFGLNLVGARRDRNGKHAYGRMAHKRGTGV
jgi:hypothetical protein